MRRAVLFLFISTLLFAALLPAAAWGTDAPGRDLVRLEGAGSLVSSGADDLVLDESPPPGPTGRAEAWVPQPPGTKKWITLEYGPYVIHPGSDLSRLDAEIAGANGYAIGFVPSVVYADGTEASAHEIHIHHAHWTWLDPDAPGSHRWFYGTGEERTQGSIMPAAKMDPRYKDGMRYGIQLSQGDRLGFINMLHNKTAEEHTVFLRVKIEFLYGTAEEIKEAKGFDMHNLKPVLIGSTFNVPRTGGVFDYPIDVTKKTIGVHSNYCNPVAACEVVPGVGQVWTVPWEGTVVIGAGHSHPGARGVVLSNMGSKKDPCPNDGDPYPGTTAAFSRNITRGNVFPSEEFQMGLTQPAWRMHVRKGDRLVLDGVYDATDYAYPDAMSYFGMYIDTREKTSAQEACKVELLNDPNATKDEITWTIPNQKWPTHHAMPTCTRCDEPGPRPEPGTETNTVHIAAHTYFPGNLGMEGSMGPPVVAKGDTLTFINEDWAEGMVRHTITSCRAPCNGEYTVNYPFHDGVFNSGALGYTWEDTYVNVHTEPRWEFDTSDLNKGFYSYYCRLHPWMRGGFYVK